MSNPRLPSADRPSLLQAPERRQATGRRQGESSPTARQLDVLRLLVLAYRARRPTPTIREIGTALGIKSTNAVSDLLKALERKGLINREPMHSRSAIPTEAGERWGAL